MPIFQQITYRITQFACYDKLEADDISELQAEFDNVDDWALLLDNIEKNGLAPITLNCINRYSFNIPPPQLIQLNALKLRHLAISKTRKKVVAQLSELLSNNNVSFIALKGLALASMIYPDESLRPMRDIDILVSSNDLSKTSLLLKEIGFDLPEQQRSEFMQGVHQLPDANLTVDGFNISIEVHHNTMHRDIFDSLTYEDAENNTQKFKWCEINMMALDHTLMLHQLCRHLQCQHPDDIIKLINVVDIVRYCYVFNQQIDWQELHNNYPHVINTVKCLHYIVPIAPSIAKHINNIETTPPNNVGECMPALSRILVKDKPINKVFGELFNPSDWWLHLHYSIAPNENLFITKLLRHPIRVFKMLLLRLKSKLS